MGLTKPTQHIHKLLAQDGAHKAEPESRILSIGSAAGGVARTDELGQQSASFLVKQAARRREGDGTRMPLKEPGADLLLQCTDVPGQRRLRQMQSSGSASEGELLRDSGETFEFSQGVVHTD